MEEHLIFVWDYDISVSVIGENIEPLYKQYVAYHQEQMSPRGHAVHLANWFLVRGCHVYIYPYVNRRKDMVALKLFLQLGKWIGEVMQGVILGRPKTKPGATLHV